jgi:isopentenyl diphosphate isomerase/L-lactate dehydrogenase-like FMN-dependent dehydrogenase
VDWPAIDALRQGVGVPVIVKGIATPEAAQAALQHGVNGIIVSGYGGSTGTIADSVLSLPAIVDAVGGRVPVLVDGSFRRGTDILKALAFGAESVLIARPAMWGLAAYGADGVQGIVEMLQTELARYMAMCGRTDVKMLDRTILRLHAATPIRKPATGSAAGGSQRLPDGAARG